MRSLPNSWNTLFAKLTLPRLISTWLMRSFGLEFDVMG
jgi:hypothetical protein